MPDFLKTYLKKRKLKNHVFLAQQTTAILKEKIPPKLDSLNTPIILGKIGTLDTHALLDLGASINIMFHAFFLKTHPLFYSFFKIYLIDS